MKRRTWTLAVVAAVATALLAGLTTVSWAGESDKATPKRDIALILDYTVAAECDVYPNYPKEGVIGNDIGWKIAPGDVVAWRYNVNEHWAVISDKKYRGSGEHPWWGFVKPECIGTSIGGEPFPTPDSSYPAGEPIPQRILEGRSAVEDDGYRAVDFRPTPGDVVNDRQRIATKGTLRDYANRFVVGNVFADWHVHTTDVRAAGWTLVYVPNAKRWGWVQDVHFG